MEQTNGLVFTFGHAFKFFLKMQNSIKRRDANDQMNLVLNMHKYLVLTSILTLIY